MEFKDLVTVGGKSGLFELIKTRQDGLIVRGLGDTSKSFVSSRKHTFTPLENIGIYLQSGDTVELKEVFNKITAQGGNLPISTAPAEELRGFFRVVLPNHDEEKVRNSDMKKIMQWHTQLIQNAFFESQDEEE